MSQAPRASSVNEDNRIDECPADTIIAISQLIAQLFAIYRTEFPELIPSELLQYTHSLDLLKKIMALQAKNPAQLFVLQQGMAHEIMGIYIKLIHRVAKIYEDGVESENGFDKRFKHPVWRTNPYFQFLKNFYEIINKYVNRWMNTIDGLDEKTREQLEFYTANFANLFAPSNYIWSNPEVIDELMHTGGYNLLRGCKNYLEDLVLNNGQLNIRMTDLKAFKVGDNLAITPGKVVFQNDLMQLIQYSPATEQVYKVPILFTPPWINKYYVLDLSSHNSMVKWLVEQGFTVFIISWVNPDSSLAEKQFEDYMLEGPVQALNMVTALCKVDKVHMVGYCIGGTLLACTLAYLRAKQDTRVLSATFLMSLVDFSDPGEIGVFLDGPQVDALERLMEKHGYLNGRILDLAFNTLRPNELIWPYFINNYLLGKPSKPFDILYWNADSSNLSYKMYIYYLRKLYLENKLKDPGGITLDGVDIDLGKINMPVMFVSSESDHITLWKSVFMGIKNFNCPVDFVLSESGHVRAVVNPPVENNKYGYRLNASFTQAKQFTADPDAWLHDAIKHDGSWWPHWCEWLIKQDKQKVTARKINESHVIEDAPGSYVMRRL